MLSYFTEDSKYILLYKHHNDYSKLYPSFISIVLSLEKILKCLLKCERCTVFFTLIYIFYFFSFYFISITKIVNSFNNTNTIIEFHCCVIETAGILPRSHEIHTDIC